MLQRLNVQRHWLASVALLAATAAWSAEPPEQALAPGRYPGPPLWRVSKGDHELWLFGTLSVVPKEMKWSSAEAERAIAGAEEVLSPPGARAATLRPVQLLRLWLRVRELSAGRDGKQLAEVLPADLYARYAALRNRYARRERSHEDQRPIIAARRIYEDAVETMGLVSGREVESGIERSARRAGVKFTDTKFPVDPESLLENAAQVSFEAESDCFDKLLATLEQDEGRIVRRARAWAIGDVAALAHFEYPDIRRDCLAFPGWPEGLLGTLQGADDRWLEEAERALAANRTTFGAVDLRELLSSDGLLARLRERGYDVQAP